MLAGHAGDDFGWGGRGGGGGGTSQPVLYSPTWLIVFDEMTKSPNEMTKPTKCNNEITE